MIFSLHDSLVIFFTPSPGFLFPRLALFVRLCLSTDAGTEDFYLQKALSLISLSLALWHFTPIVYPAAANLLHIKWFVSSSDEGAWIPPTQTPLPCAHNGDPSRSSET